jgi:nicotinate-nucleotide pyrophosphorylase (carboxylating)
MSSSDEIVHKRLAAAFVAEDVGRGDRTTESVVPPGAAGAARIEAREPAVVAGLAVARACFDAAGGGIDWDPVVSDGERVAAGQAIVRIRGPMRTILTGERTALNLLARLSGVATLTAKFVAAVAGTPARIVDTRKTTPGLRVLEKYAVRAGGGTNHRFGLDDGILIKDNHIAAAGGITEAVGRALSAGLHGLLIEVEVTDLDGLEEAVAAGAHAVLLDNMSPEIVAEAVTRAGGKVMLESSGGITLENVRDYAVTGVDLISVGALTHSVRAIDLSLEVVS